MSNPRRQVLTRMLLRNDLLSINDILERLKCSRSALYGFRRRSGFPQPVRAGSLVRWPRKAVDEWSANRNQQREAA